MDARKTKRFDAKKKWPLILTAAVIVFIITGVAVLAYQYLYIREINFYGNRHLSGDELKKLTGCSTSSRLFSVSTTEIYGRLRKSPWIKQAVVRKDLTGRMDVYITEAVAVSVLMTGENPYLVDREGVILEEMKKAQVYFLPLIKIDNESAREAFHEAVELAVALQDRKVAAQSGNIEITGTRPEDITLRFDDLTARMGAGEFAKKLEKLYFVKEEISKRSMKVEYVDLRFADKIVVKPLRHGGDAETQADAAGKTRKARPKKSGNKGAGGRTKGNVG
jgi:cell division protein FtsQ